MNKIVRDIIDNSDSTRDKEKSLDELTHDIKIAKGVLSGKYKHCPDCDEYYLKKSFLTDYETRESKICTYCDPINSGGNDYADGYVDITYELCPKGHKHEINREERLR